MLEQFAQEVIIAVVAGMATFLLQGAIYRYIYKREVWRSHLFEVVLKKTRRWVYLTMVVLSLKVTAELFPPAADHQKPIDIVVTYALIMMSGILAIEVLSAFVFDYLLRDVRKVEIPTLYRDITRFGLYVVLFGIFCTLLGFDVGALITGGTVLTLVIGFATQESLGNVFAGIFLHSSKPFTRGDWVRVGEREGFIEKVEWRATTIRTRDNDYVIFPNAMLAKMEITNYSAPTVSHAVTLPIGVHYRHSPTKVKRILIECALKTHKVLSTPEPISRIRSFDDSSVRYEVRFWLEDYADAPNIQGSVLEKVWYHFKREEIEIPYPIRTVEIQRREKVDKEGQNFKLLKRIDFLSEFSDHDIKYLASRLTVVTYTAGEPVIKQGETGRSFYILREGRVEIEARDADGKVFFSKELGPGEFFGEISLLTGEPRTATVTAREESELLRLDKEAFRRIMEENPRADELISMVLARRKEYRAHEKAALDASMQAPETSDSTTSTTAVLVKKIREFFAY